LGKPDISIIPHGCWLLLDEDDTSRMTIYQGFFSDPLSQEDIRHIRVSASTGLPTGNDRFREELEKTLSIRPGHGKRGRPGKSTV